MPGADHETDSTIIPFSRDRHRFAAQLEAVYRENYDHLARYLTLRMGSAKDAQDLAQSTYLKLLEKVDHLKEGNLRALLFVTARNLSTDALRRAKLESRWFASSHEDSGRSDEISSGEPSADRVVVSQQQIALVRDILEELPPKCRAAFNAYKFEEESYTEIAGKLGVSENMVRKYVLRAVSYCSRRMIEMEGWE